MLAATVAVAQEAEQVPTAAESARSDTSGVAQPFHEVVVVTASRTEQRLGDSPAAITVLGGDQLQQMPSDNFGDLLRNVPGLNVSQTSGWDVSIASRNASSVLPSGQLVLVDNRSVFKDFNGVVWWNAIPLNSEEVRQIEALRGPAGAIWGANAADGVINIITKTPREMAGTTVTLGGGESATRHAAVTHAAVRGKLGYKVSGSWYRQDPYSRPTGTIPGTDGPGNPGGTPYPDYENLETEIPKFNFRVDYDQDDETTWSVSGGYAGLQGMILTPAGPADWREDTFDAFGKIDWIRRNARVTFYGDYFDNPTAFFPLSGNFAEFHEQNYNLDIVDTRTAGARHRLTYGGNVRLSSYRLTLAPGAKDREQYGVFLQDEIRLTDHFRWMLGARVDDIDPMGTAVAPRTTLFYSPIPDQTFRASYNQAFLAPTALDNYGDAPVGQIVITIPTMSDSLDLVFPLQFVGRTDLKEERLEAFEVGWVGSFANRVQVSLAAYRNELDDAIVSVASEFYSSDNPPPDWPLPPALLDIPPQDGGFAGIPSQLESTNIAKVVNQGVEIGIQVRPAREWSAFLNYSWQDEPEVSGVDLQPLPGGGTRHPFNDPPRHRFNVGVNWSDRRFFANANANYQDEAFWADVLTPAFWGPTRSFTIVNAAAGVRLPGNQVVVSVDAKNIFDDDAQQHVWGDLIRRKVMAQISYSF
jgi:iron complex outermembrane receptor protein